MFWSKSSAIFLLSLFTLAVMVTPAYSTTITTYSDQATWLAATTGVTTDNFEGLAPAGSYTMYGSGITQNQVTFIGISGQTGVADTSSGFFGGFANFGTVDAGFVSQTTGIHITLQTPVTAIGVNLFTSQQGLTDTVTNPTNASVPTFTSPTLAFFGLTSDTPFSTVDIQTPASYNYAFFDNFQFGAAQVQGGDPGEVPEAGTSLLIGTGLLGLAVFRHRSRQPRA